MIKFFLNLFKEYGFNLFLVITYEIKYILSGYKGNYINILNNESFTDNIPVPYLFLEKIYFFIKKKKIKNIIDLGCGSGRFIYFMQKKIPGIKLYGLEINKEIFQKTGKMFFKNNNIFIINNNILNETNIFKKRFFDIYYLNDPFKKKKDYNKLFKKIFNSSKKKRYIITVNINKKNMNSKKLKLIYNYNIKKKHLKIFQIN